MIEHPIYSACIEAGRSRLVCALHNKDWSGLAEGIELEISILSYPVARIIANLTESRIVLGRFARWEAARAHSFFKSEDTGVLSDLRRDLGFPKTEGGMDFKDYLRFSTDIAKSDPSWKLSNRIIGGGKVVLDDSSELLLLREAVRLKVSEPVKASSAPKKLKEIAIKIKASEGLAESKITTKELEGMQLPPCIKHMLSLLEVGEASHSTMFILGTYFINLGLPIDDVVELFRRFPNFNEEKARYQLEFLSGENGGTKYSCPSCSKIKSYSLCDWDCGIKHPLQYKKKS